MVILSSSKLCDHSILQNVTQLNFIFAQPLSKKNSRNEIESISVDFGYVDPRCNRPVFTHILI